MRPGARKATVRRSAALLGLVLACTCAAAQVIPSNEFHEGDTPPPPPLKLDGLLPLDMGSTELRWGVDPSSIRIDSDRVVRYVVVGQSTGGAVNAFYEGLRCDTAQVRVYARHARDGDWVPATGGWMPMQEGSSATRHSLVFARTGGCIGRAANRSPEQIARDLGRTANYRFSNEAR
jgi:hypothetical protein